MNTYHIDTPVPKEKSDKLRAGDIVYLTGRIITLRDRSHRRIDEYARKGLKLPFQIKDRAILHCGPVIRYGQRKQWEAVSVGATSSSRFSPFVASLIKEFDSNIIIGKGNLFAEAVEVLKHHRAVFLLAVGGCAALYGSQVKKVVANHWEEFGMADSVWEFEMESFGPLCVGIDCMGNNLYENLREKILKKNLRAIYETLDIDPNVDATWWPQAPAGTKLATDYSTCVKPVKKQ